MIRSGNVNKWLEHRYGLTPLDNTFPRSQKKALELNKGGTDTINSFGNKLIYGFVGFLDIVGFSETVQGSTPHEVQQYLQPFLDGVANDIADDYCCIDKTIGDEVMLFVPDQEEEVGAPVIIINGQILHRIVELQQRLGKEYKLRLGLAYGEMLLGQVKGKSFSEWTLFGEVVNLAKRLQTVNGIDVSGGFGGAFGVLESDIKAVEKFDLILSYCAGFASNFLTYRTVPLGEQDQLKGISAYRSAILSLKHKGQDNQ